MYSNTNKNRCILDIETTSFEPWNGKIICIGSKDVNTGEIKLFQNENEELILINFFRYFNLKDYTEIIGYNISYDIRYIFAKSIKYRLQNKNFFLNTKKTDIMMLLKNVNGYSFNKPGTLNQWALALLGRQKLFCNTQIPDLYKDKRTEDILEYCANDLELEHDLWNRIMYVLGNNITKPKNLIVKNSSN